MERTAQCTHAITSGLLKLLRASYFIVHAHLHVEDGVLGEIEHDNEVAATKVEALCADLETRNSQGMGVWGQWGLLGRVEHDNACAHIANS